MSIFNLVIRVSLIKIYTMKYLILPLLLVLLVSSCKKEEGCTDPTASNYNADAEKDDGSCTYTTGCTDAAAFNFNPDAVNDDNSCLYICNEIYATNYNDTTSDPVCEYASSIIIWLDETASQYFDSLTVPFLSVSVADEQILGAIETVNFNNNDDIGCADTSSGPIHHIYQWENASTIDVQLTVYSFAGTIMFQSIYTLYPSACFQLQLTRAEIEIYQASQ